MDPRLVQEASLLAALGGAGLVALWYARRGAAPKGPARQEGSPRAMGDLLEELKRVSQSMTASLDRRSTEIKALIAEADRRLARLEALGEPARAPASPQRPPELPSDASPEMKAVFESVYRQADGGRILTDIARETGLNKTAVSLILNLPAMQKQPGGSPRSVPSR